jgi:hypothetical protein
MMKDVRGETGETASGELEMQSDAKKQDKQSETEQVDRG